MSSKNKEFFEELTTLGWQIKLNEKCVNWESLASGRLVHAPDELHDFISSYSICANPDDTAWFLNPSDYADKTDTVFPWNEFKNQSKESADAEEWEKINTFWNAHIPFLFSVKNGYTYLAYIIERNDRGKIVCGNEPIYEEVSVIAESLDEFKEEFIRALKGTSNSDKFRIII